MIPFTCSSFFSRLLSLLLPLLLCLPLQAQMAPVLVWQQPDPISFSTPLSSVQLNAVALKSSPVPVPLSLYYNAFGITTDGVPFANSGLDGGGRTFSASSLGQSISWRGISFPLGPADVADVVSGGTIALPAGQFASLYLLGNLVDNQPPVGTLTIAYTDGSTDIVTQSLSDWTFPKNFPGESIVKCAPSHNNFDGQKYITPACVYGYPIPLNSSKVVQSVTLPNDRYMVFLSMVLVPPTVSGSFAYSPAAGTVPFPGTSILTTHFTPTDTMAFFSADASVSLVTFAPAAPLVSTVTWPPPAPIGYGTLLGATQLDAAASAPLNPVNVPLDSLFSLPAIYPDGYAYVVSGFNGDGAGNSYSFNQLGTAISFDKFVFPLGAPADQDVVTSTTVPLPAGSYTTLYLIGTGNIAPEPSQPFTVVYSDGSRSTTLLDISPWRSPQGFAGETIVAQTTEANTPSGTKISGTFDLYGYRIALDPTRMVQSLILPDNNGVFLFAAGLGLGGAFPAIGTFSYVPPAGTILPVGIHTLTTAFAATESNLFLPSNGSTQLVVKSALVVSANSATRFYGVSNPVFSGIVIGALPGDQFSLSFSTPATLLSSVGQYAIIPAVSGSNLISYVPSLQNGVLSIVPAPVTLSVSSIGGITQGRPVNVVLSVQSTTSGTPTGTVTLTDNGKAFGSATLVAGTASFSAALFGGPNQLVALYSGDLNFQPARLVISPAISGGPLDFVLSSPNGSTLNTTWGQGTSLDLQIAPLNGMYQSMIYLTLSGALPPLATHSLSPNQLAFDAGPSTIHLTVNTRLLSEAAPRRAPWKPLEALDPLLAVVLISYTGGRRTRRLRLICLPLLAGLLLACATGCGNGYHDVSYPITVVATDGTTTHSLSLTLQVQAPR